MDNSTLNGLEMQYDDKVPSERMISLPYGLETRILALGPLYNPQRQIEQNMSIFGAMPNQRIHTAEERADTRPEVQRRFDVKAQSKASLRPVQSMRMQYCPIPSEVRKMGKDGGPTQRRNGEIVG